MSSNTIIHIINSLGRGGAEVLLVNTIKLLPEYEHILVTLSHDDELLHEIRPLLSAQYSLQATPVSRWPLGVIQLRRIIKKHKPLLVHAHLQTAGLLARLACPREIPLFYTIHNIYSVDAFSRNKFALPLERLVARSYHHLIGVSDIALQDYHQHVPNAGSGDVVYNMVGSEFFSNQTPPAYVARTPLKMVAVGTLDSRKNYPYVLEAMADVKHLPISLDIYGAGLETQKLHEIKQANGLDNVRFMGNSSTISEVLPTYHLYVISSSYEGFGIAPLEAMATGLPVLASDIPVFREVAGDTVFYFDLSNAQSLSTLLSAIFVGEISLEALAAAGKKHAYALCMPQAYKDTLIRTYAKHTGNKILNTSVNK